MPLPLPPPADIASDVSVSAEKKLGSILAAAHQEETNAAIAEALGAALLGLPPPLNAGAKGMGDAIFALMLATPPPGSGTGAIKIFSYGIAMAVAMFVWCLIKNFLHALPIIGIFVPACSNDTAIVPPVPPSISQLNKDALTSFIRSEKDKLPQYISPPPLPVVAGPTFAEYVVANPASNRTGPANAQNSSIITPQRDITNNSANIPSTVSNPSITANTDVTVLAAAAHASRQNSLTEELVSSEGLRKLFGL